jgi:phosphoribosylformylglycinamidine (FGAM) synthase-like amidotransferase family enzyme
LDLLNKQIDEKTQEVVTNANTICGSANPEQSLLWLKGIIQKAEEDRLTKKYMGNYMGKITSTSYRNEPVFYIRMALGSGGIYAYIYDCNGKTVYINPDDMLIFEQNAQQGKLIYSNS